MIVADQMEQAQLKVQRILDLKSQRSRPWQRRLQIFKKENCIQSLEINIK